MLPTDAFAPFPHYHANFRPNAGSVVAAVARIDKLEEELDVLLRANGHAVMNNVAFNTHGDKMQLLKVLSQSMRTGSYLPAGPDFLTIPNRTGGMHQVRRRTLLDRAVSARLASFLVGQLHDIALPGSYGFPPTLGKQQMTATLLSTARESGYQAIATGNVVSDYDNVRIGEIMLDFARQVPDPGLLGLIEVVLRGCDASKNPWGNRDRGIDKDDPFSPVAVNLRLHHALDIPLIDAGLRYPFRYRFFDKFIYLCRSTQEGMQMIHHTESLLGNAGLWLHGTGRVTEIMSDHLAAFLESLVAP